MIATGNHGDFDSLRVAPRPYLRAIDNRPYGCGGGRRAVNNRPYEGCGGRLPFQPGQGGDGTWCPGGPGGPPLREGRHRRERIDSFRIEVRRAINNRPYRCGGVGAVINRPKVEAVRFYVTRRKQYGKL